MLTICLPEVLICTSMIKMHVAKGPGYSKQRFGLT